MKQYGRVQYFQTGPLSARFHRKDTEYQEGHAKGYAIASWIFRDLSNPSSFAFTFLYYSFENVGLEQKVSAIKN